MANSDVWDRYDSVIQRYAPQTFERFRPPASQEAIAMAEKSMRTKFPRELRVAYARHDGFALFQNFPGNSLAQMTAFWDIATRCQESLEMDDMEVFVQQQPTPAWEPFYIRPVSWYKKWLPIASDGISSYCIDLAPGPRGTPGQVIGGSDAFHLVAPSLNSWVTFLTDGFESGRFVEDSSIGEACWVDTKFGDVPFSKQTFAFYGERGLR